MFAKKEGLTAKRIMRKLTVIFGLVLIVVTSLAIKNALATVIDSTFNFTEYSGNPLFGGATAGVDRAYQPYIIKIDGIYHMWYGDGVYARYTSSIYPDFHDAQFPGTIVVGTTASQPYKFTVYYDSDGWTLGGVYYSQKLVAYYTDAADNWTANPKVAVSDDGINWTFVAQTTGVNIYPSPGAFYKLSVLYEGDNVWKGYGDQGQAIIQYYTSTDGINWTGVATDILSINSPQSWEGTSGAISPYVFKVHDTYVMTYSAGKTDNNQAIGIAYSDNGEDFIKSTTNPIFSIDDGVLWRVSRTYNSYIMYDNGLWRLYFQGRNAGGNYSAGMATSTLPDIAAPTIILNGTATTTLTVGETYNELGATASDAIDPSVSVLTTGSVNTAIIGDYIITYTATDASNNTATAARTVHVIAASPGPTPPTSPSGTGGEPVTVKFLGQAYPGSTIDVLFKNDQTSPFLVIPAETSLIKDDGSFEINNIGLVREQYLYALRIKDKDGRETTLSFDVNLTTRENLTLRDIFVPPTIEVKNMLLLRSEDLQLVGYATPNNTIEVEIDGDLLEGTASADKTGRYEFVTNVGTLAADIHYVRVRQMNKDGERSSWSQTKSFKKSLLLTPKADFNIDGRVDITDWSIFLFHWTSPDQELSSMVDLDGNEKVDVVDLSIFLKTMQI